MKPLTLAALAMLILMTLYVLAPSVAQAGDTMLRCGNQLIERGDSMFKVEQECGPPVSTRRVGERTTFTVFKDAPLKVKDAIYIEEWVYNKDSGYYILTFEGSRLVSKEYFR
ncbi:MAG: DUF2845 domain-containing protein [Desulfobacteraceae bacterium]|nr:DUF2845 domain-containing protein [Desulfobacteraceae bacterium]